jgi:ABC-type multidrug transport system permease subunit
MKAYVLIGIALAWLFAMCWFVFGGSGFGWGIQFPEHTPPWLMKPAFVVITALVFAGWLLPLMLGVRDLAKR